MPEPQTAALVVIAVALTASGIFVGFTGHAAIYSEDARAEERACREDFRAEALGAAHAGRYLEASAIARLVDEGVCSSA